MLATLAIVLLVLIVGERGADVLERRQQELVLRKLPLPEAHAYYNRLRQRSRRIRILRGLTLASLFALAYVYRHATTRRTDRSSFPQVAPAGPERDSGASIGN